MGQAQKATESLKRALQLNPSDEIVKETLAQCVFELSKDEYKRLCAERASGVRVDFVPGKGESMALSLLPTD